MSWSVYIHTAPNGKVYVGTTSMMPRKRWLYGHGYADNKDFFADIKKYGWKNITHKIVAEQLTEEQAYVLEQKLISEHQSNNPEYGYNKAGGGFGTTGFFPSDESRKRMSDSHKGNQNHCVVTFQLNKNGDIVARYSSVKEASEITGVNYKSIVNCCSGVTKQAGGYYWRH